MATELDKFKRRMIRSVARLLLQEKRPEDDVWQELGKETGCDVKLLWQRMRALTLKKMKRLLAADDRSENVAAIARLSLTDWLLIDLVLVHEKIDVIGVEKIASARVEHKPLTDLFALVQKFQIEGLSGDELADRWYAATHFYNSGGRNCSPMLLQKRWYQMKEQTRASFYSLWFNYKGNARLWKNVQRNLPTRLQMAIAKRFPQVVTHFFPEWEEQIQLRLVILPEEFENKVRSVQPEPCSANDPDLVLLEPNIEVIDLSDSEGTAENQEDNVPSPSDVPDDFTQNDDTMTSTEADLGVTIKQEPIDFECDGLSNVKILETTHMAVERDLIQTQGLIDHLDMQNIHQVADIEKFMRLKQGIEEIGKPCDELIKIKASQHLTKPCKIQTVGNLEIDAASDEFIKMKADQYLTKTSKIQTVGTPEIDAASVELIKMKADQYLTKTSKIQTVGTPEIDAASDELIKMKADQYLTKTSKIQTVGTPGIDAASDELIKMKAGQCLTNTSKIQTVETIEIDAASNELIKMNAGKDLTKTSQIQTVGTSEIAAVSDGLITMQGEQYLTKTSKIQTLGTPEIDAASDDLIKMKVNQYLSKTNDSKVAEVSLDVVEDNDIQVHENATSIYDTIQNDLIKVKADRYIRKKIEEMDVSSTNTIKHNSVVETNKALDKIVIDEDSDFVVDDIIKQRAEDFVRKAEIKKLAVDVIVSYDISTDMSFADDGIEVVDDGIEYIDEENAAKNDAKIESEMTTDTDIKTEKQDVSEESGKFDLKLLMAPVVYTMKLDHMSSFKDSNFNYVKEKTVIDGIIVESKPKSRKSVYGKRIEQENQINENPAVNEDKGVTDDDLFINNSTFVDEDIGNNDDDLFNHCIDEYDNNNDDDVSDNEVSDDQRVKLSSSLLQKPKSRSYNPIQLCKNPDFNTRLKRLTVGFISSVRNRQQLKTCKPMTIDLHKAFESKLINTTLYLKSGDAGVQQRNEDNQSQQTVSVMPSAMPVQSLMNIDDFVGSSFSPIDLTKTSAAEERNKVINLRDITEIRRINQRLLTAEVTPIQIQNNGHKSPEQSASTSTNQLDISSTHNNDVKKSNTTQNLLIENLKHDIYSSMSKAVDLDASINKTNVAVNQPSIPSSNQTLDTSLISNTGKPEKQMTTTDKTADSDNSLPFETRKTVPKLDKIPATSTKSNYNKNISVPWVSWKKPKPKNSELDEFLITIDTLNKMINKINGSETEFGYSKKKKPVPVKESKTKPKETPKEKPVVVTDVTPKPQKPKIRKAKGRPRKNILQEKPYCCWSREKIERVGTKQRARLPHQCAVSMCVCCCRDEREKAITLFALSKKQNEFTPASDSIILSDDEDDKLMNACKSIENVVQQSHHVPMPVVRVFSGNNLYSQRVISTPIPSNDNDISRNDVQGTVDVATPQEQTITEKNTCSNTVCPSITISVASLHSPTPQTNENNETEPESIEPMKVSTSMHSVINKGTSPSTKMKVPSSNSHVLDVETELAAFATILQKKNEIDTPIISKAQTKLKKNVGPKSLKENVQTIKTAQGQIIIDGSQNLSKDPDKFQKKDDKVLFLNSKNISKKPTASPIYLGKNKILLTTVRFPRDIQTFKNSAEEVYPTVIPTLPLPVGVHLILLPTGQVSYNLDPGVELNDEQLLSLLPTIIASVQQQIAMTPQPTNAIPTLNQDEVIRLSDDESQLPNVETAAADTSSAETTIIAVESTSPIKLNKSTVDHSTTFIEERKNQNEFSAGNNGNEAPINDEEKKKVIESGELPEYSGNYMSSEKGGNVQKEMSSEMLNKSHKELAVCSIELNKAIDVDKSCENGSEIMTEEIDRQSNTASNASMSRNTLLSDLMEMSGISAEDATPAPQALQEAASEELNLPGITLVPNIQISNSNVQNLPELFPITSLTELKYACENNGLFFKLDFDTGSIVPINVCIKRNSKPKAIPAVIKTVIDLTDDQELKLTEKGVPPLTPIPVHTNESILNKHLLNSQRNIKPIKMFKVVHPTILKKKATEKCPSDSYVKRYRVKRKQNLGKTSKIEAKIDLVDSDAPMEEEYLLESSDSENTYKTDNNNTEKILTSKHDSDDSSDDEPLAKKFLRTRQTNENAKEKNDEVRVSNKTTEENQGVRTEGNSQPAPTELPAVPEVPNQSLSGEIESADMDTTPDLAPAVVSFMDESDNDDAQDDCILGF